MSKPSNYQCQAQIDVLIAVMTIMILFTIVALLLTPRQASRPEGIIHAPPTIFHSHLDNTSKFQVRQISYCFLKQNELKDDCKK